MKSESNYKLFNNFVLKFIPYYHKQDYVYFYFRLVFFV